jgi:hypothetical protein
MIPIQEMSGVLNTLKSFDTLAKGL